MRIIGYILETKVPCSGRGDCMLLMLYDGRRVLVGDNMDGSHEQFLPGDLIMFELREERDIPDILLDGYHRPEENRYYIFDASADRTSRITNENTIKTFFTGAFLGTKIFGHGKQNREQGQ